MEKERAKELMENPNVWAWDGLSYSDEEPDEEMKAWLKKEFDLDWDEEERKERELDARIERGEL